jgi:hypothetical protein
MSTLFLSIAEMSVAGRERLAGGSCGAKSSDQGTESRP